MAQTFDIRFARSAGLAALLEVPVNRFRWKGGGRLSIDAQGISIAVKRGLLALFGAKHTQRISNENLRSVYREGEALRVEYETAESTRAVLPFWAGDRDTAAQIVRLLPTSQTVEIEHSTDATHSGKPGRRLARAADHWHRAGGRCRRDLGHLFTHVIAAADRECGARGGYDVAGRLPRTAS